MTFEVDINGRLRVVSIEPIGAADPSGGRFHIVVHDHADAGHSDVNRPVRRQTFEVDARRTDLGISLVYIHDQRSVDAALVERAVSEFLVQLPRVTVTATVNGRRSRRDAGDNVAGAGEQRLVAPMPGRVVRVLVKPGDEVAAKQGLVVIEAMKMENELVAVRPGRVSEVAVSEGTSVEAGRLLVRVE